MPIVDPIGGTEGSALWDGNRAWEALQSKYTTAGNWATWATGLVDSNITSISNKLGTDIVGTNLAAVNTAVEAISQYTAPTTDITDFYDNLIVAVRNKLLADIGTPSTGLGTAEAALFARETARQNTIRAQAYTEITTFHSSAGFDIPPGAVAAKITEASNVSSITLSDSSAAIMAESARLAQAWNQTTLTASLQLFDLVSRIGIEVEKLRISGIEVNARIAGIKAELAQKTASVVIDTAFRQLTLEVTTLAGLSQAASQMVASALNSVSVSASVSGSSNQSSSFSNSISTSTSESTVTSVSN